MEERYFYSPTTRGFYPLSMKEQYENSLNGWPADAVEINTNDYQALLEGQSRGQVIVPGDDGNPKLVTPEIDHDAIFGTQKESLLMEAERIIAPLERAVKFGIATEEEKLQLEAWEKYSVMVNRATMENPVFPEKPGETAEQPQTSVKKRVSKAARR
ncbi:phage tail protein [Enterobacter sp. CGMCC 5087]|uniref:tail fiber assembly protein n=1 Tax=Enterobacter sp. CGMCC 5087 TaxID=2183878 RepID=UPI000D67D1AF|nr:tail fiber assembly protein [Enterobacter sp. CGMCC 5087]PWI80486.1 phage tail protein [Enterobacter sp. CGMCC 5087]